MSAQLKQPLAIYQDISEVTGELAKIGISKDRKNTQQGFMFRGIDDVYNSLAPVLAKVGITIVPYTLERHVIERETQRGGTLFYTTVLMDFTFTSAKDGSSVVARVYGEAMDSGDKATNKAMSAAYKYACFQTFCIPTEGDNDADQTTHEVKSTKVVDVRSAAGKASRAKETYPADASKQATDAILQTLTLASTQEELRKFAVDNQEVLSKLVDDDRAKVRDAYRLHETKLKETANAA